MAASILRARGLFRREYTGSTLRQHYGLPRPASVFADGGAAAAAAPPDGGAAGPTEQTEPAAPTKRELVVSEP